MRRIDCLFDAILQAANVFRGHLITHLDKDSHQSGMFQLALAQNAN
jgi:hypothetical protein